ncbi:hypothetical protein [Flavobacterium sp.]|uniref:hypothetical protein n=1 Tax=Flavobacterium sp. TaxID=239 RepID=UPI003D2E5785
MYIINNKEFLIIEPPIYTEFSNFDEIIKCLIVIISLLPVKFNSFPKSISYKLVRYSDFLGNKYPAIGINSVFKEDYKKIPNFIELYELVEELITEIGIDAIRKEAKELKTISWQKLNEIGYSE